MNPRSWISCLAMLAAVSANVHAVPGANDPGWGSAGRVQLTVGGYSNEQGRAAALQADGRIVVAAQVDAAGGSGVVVRFEADGSPDLSFAGGGAYLLPGTPAAVVIQPDGRILVAISGGGTGCGAIQVVRLFPDGTRDSSFNATSRSNVCSPLSGIVHYFPASMVLQPDGKVVVGGQRLGGTPNEFLIVRYQPTGSADPSFGSDGLVITDIIGGNDAIAALALQPDGRIVAAGAASANGSSDAFIVVARYNPDGTLDASFGAGGKVGTALSPSFALSPTSVALQPDGRIVVTTNRGSVLRYAANGAADSTFGAGGRVDGALGTGFPNLKFVGVLPDGRIMVAGNADNGYASVARLLANGSLDSTYGIDGTTPPNTPAQGATAVVTPDASVWSIGYRSTGGNDDIALLRHTPTGRVDESLGNRGLVARDLGLRSPTYAKAVAQQGDGKIIVGGGAHFANFDKGFALARLNRDGTLDTAFGAQGLVLSAIPGVSAVLSQVRALDDGKIIAAGSLFQGYVAQSVATVVVRYLANGAVDTSFGAGGAALLYGSCLSPSDITTTPDCKVLVAVDSDGGVVVASVAHGLGPGRRIVVNRLNAAGALDTNFAGHGVAVLEFQGGHGDPVGLFVRLDGKIVIVALSGSVGAAAASYLSFARLRSNGMPDLEFGANGIVVSQLQRSDAAAELQRDNRILVASRAAQDGYFLERFNPDASPDTRFGSFGGVSAPLGAYYQDARVRSLALQRDGRIVVVGTAQGSDTGRDIVAARFTVNGRLDKTYAESGIAGLKEGRYDGFEEAAAAIVQDDGRLVIAGNKPPTPQSDSVISVARLLGGTLPAGDFDANGTADLVLRNDADGSLVLWLMNGLAATAYASLGGPGTSDAPRFFGDFNGDGKADLVWEDADGTTSITLFSGASILADEVIMPAAAQWRVTHVGDFDGDGKDDLLWAHPSGALRVQLMDGVTAKSAVEVSFPGWSVDKVADLDGDGNADVILRHTDGTYMACLMNGLATISCATLPSPGPGWFFRHATDFDGDGKADLVWVHTSGAVQVWLMDGLVLSRIVSLQGGGAVTITHIADLDGDGRADILWRYPDGKVIASLIGPTLAIREEGVFAASGNPWRIVQARDFDGDGKADLLWRNVDGTLAMWLMDGLMHPNTTGIQGPRTPLP